MKNIPIAIKFLVNVLFFLIYSLVGIVLGNFLFGLILTALGKVVPGSSDPIHIKIAGVILLFIFIITLVFRKYFYIYMGINNDSIKNYKKNDKVKTAKKVNEKSDLSGKKMKIYIDKEIK